MFLDLSHISSSILWNGFSLAPLVIYRSFELSLHILCLLHNRYTGSFICTFEKTVIYFTEKSFLLFLLLNLWNSLIQSSCHIFWETISKAPPLIRCNKRSEHFSSKIWLPNFAMSVLTLVLFHFKKIHLAWTSLRALICQFIFELFYIFQLWQ